MGTVDVAGARLHYDVSGTGPVLMLLGAPMPAGGFAAIEPLLAEDYTVVRYDPRGIGRSTRGDAEATPDVLADDVHHVLSAVGDEPAYVFGSSGGGVTGLALAARHPEQVRTLVAHEPPLVELLPESAEVMAGFEDVYAINRGEGSDAAMRKFFTLAGFQAGPGASPTPSTPEEVARNDYFLSHMAPWTTRYRPDFAALGAANVVVGGGLTSKGQLAHRTATAFAEQLGTPLTEFPGDHIGFIFEPEPFARQLRGLFA
jgi:clorobiocin biosynthesis protein CloN7